MLNLEDYEGTIEDAFEEVLGALQDMHHLLLSLGDLYEPGAIETLIRLVERPLEMFGDFDSDLE